MALKFLQDRRTDDEVCEVARTLRQYSLFEGLDETQLRRLVPALRIKEFCDEEIVCHCPDATHDAFIILEEKVAVTPARGDEIHTLEIEGTGVWLMRPVWWTWRRTTWAPARWDLLNT